MFEWLRSAEPGTPDDRTVTPELDDTHVHESITEPLAGCQHHELTDKVLGQEPVVQWLGQLLAEGRYVEATTAVLDSNPPSAAWDTCEGEQQHRALSPVISVHVDASDDGSKALAVGQSAASLQQGAPALQHQQNNVWQGYCAKLHIWSAKALQQACPDSSMSTLQRQQLKQAAANRVGAQKTAQLPSWWRLYPPLSSTQGCQLAAAVYHLSSSKDQAWTSISQALWHGLAVDIRAAEARALRRTTTNKSALKKGSTAEQQGNSSISSSHNSFITSNIQQQHHWSPQGTAKRLAELQGKQSSRVKEVLAQFPCSGTLGVELREAGQALLPTTYLQLVGQKLLGQATAAIPVLLSLPETPPDWLLRGLFTKPFAEALRLALTDLQHEPDGVASPYIPHLEQQQHNRGFKRIYPSEASVTMPTAAAGAGADNMLNVEGLMWRAGNRALLGVLACVFRDVQEFEAGLLLLVPDSRDSSTIVRRRSSISSCTGIAAAEAGQLCRNGLCKPQLAQLLAKDLKEAVAGCRNQLGELMAQSTKQMMLMTLQEELQQPLHELLLSAAAVTADIWPTLTATPAPAAGPASDNIASSLPAASGVNSEATAQQPLTSGNCSVFGAGGLWFVDSAGSWELAATGSKATGIARIHHTGSFQRGAGGVSPSSNSFSRRSVAGQLPTVGQGHRSPSQCVIDAATGTSLLQQQQQQQQLSRQEFVRQPQQVTQAQAQLLGFARVFTARRHQYPLLIQDTLVTALIGALSSSMQHIAGIFDPTTTTSSSSRRSTEAFFREEQTGYCCCCISTVLCIHRRLLWLQEVWAPQKPQQTLLLLEQSIQQAATLAASLQQSLTQQLVCTFKWAVLLSLQEQPWTSHKQPLSSKRSTSGGNSSQQQQQQQQPKDGGSSRVSAAVASPGVRVWHMLMQTWQYTLRRVLSAAMTVDIMGEVLHQSCSALHELYMPLQPSPTWISIYQQDIAVIATTAWEFSQPLQVTVPLAIQLGVGTRMSVAGGLCGMRRSVQGQRQALGGIDSPGCRLANSMIEGENSVQMQEQHTEGVGLPAQVVSEVSDLCKQLVMKAAELSGGAAAAAAAAAPDGGNSSTGSVAADPTSQQHQHHQQQVVQSSSERELHLQHEAHPACLAKSVSASGAAVKSHTGSSAGLAGAQQVGSWDWLSMGLQLILDSRVLGQCLPARRLLDVMSHAAIGTELDDVEADAWVQHGRALLAEKASNSGS